jgi:uncharacterized protein (TIGR03118 family)
MISRRSVRNEIVVALAVFTTAVVVLLPGVGTRPVQAKAVPEFFHQTNLVSDQPGVALITDPDLVNPWGISFAPTSPFWVADNVSSKSTLYRGDVNGSAFTKVSLIVSIPPFLEGFPTGTVWNGTTTDFLLPSPTGPRSATFLFASQVGAITGWNGTIQTAVPPGDSVYTGLAIGQAAGANYLYAADFKHGRIDVYDRNFHIATLDGSFDDPELPRSYSNFNIQNLGGKLYVTYAQQSHKEPDEETDKGSGFVDVFDTSGHLLQRLVLGNHLNAPWGLALAPGDNAFGAFSGALLVGNFGDGQIHAYDAATGKYIGEMKDESGKPLVIDGLWGITFGNGVAAGDRNALYFAAGPDDETHGLFGSLRVAEKQ